MRYSRVHEFAAVCPEAVPGVKRRGAGLRVQPDPLESLLTGQFQKILQERASRPLSPPFRQNREPADTAFRQESTGSDRRVIRSVRQCMLATLVFSVPLQLERDTLLLDENPQPYGAQRGGLGGPAGRLDGESGVLGHGSHYN